MVLRLFETILIHRRWNCKYLYLPIMSNKRPMTYGTHHGDGKASPRGVSLKSLSRAWTDPELLLEEVSSSVWWQPHSPLLCETQKVFIWALTHVGIFNFPNSMLITIYSSISKACLSSSVRAHHAIIIN